MEQRYTALRTIGSIYKILGLIAAGVTALAVLAICVGGSGGARSALGLFGGALGGLIGSLFVLIYGGGIALTLYAAGEGVFLLLALEENTRLSAMLMQRQVDTSAQARHADQLSGAPQSGPALTTTPIGRAGQVLPRE
jgi:hypothetical protein